MSTVPKRSPWLISTGAVATLVMAFVSLVNPTEGNAQTKGAGQVTDIKQLEPIAKPKDAWDKADIIAKSIAAIGGVMFPAAIAWGVHLYSRRQSELENSRQEREFRLHQLDAARQFLPQLLSQQTTEKWAAIHLIQILGDDGLARRIAEWVVRGYVREEDRELIERMMRDKDSYIANLATDAFRSVFQQQPEVAITSKGTSEAVYKLNTSDAITHLGEITFHDYPAENHGRWVVTRGNHTLVLPKEFRMGTYLVTNQFFLDFSTDNGYTTESNWIGTPPGARERCMTQDGRTLGPSTWPSAAGVLLDASTIRSPGSDITRPSLSARGYRGGTHPRSRVGVGAYPPKTCGSSAQDRKRGDHIPGVVNLSGTTATR